MPKVAAHAPRFHSIRVPPGRKRSGIRPITLPTRPPTKTEPRRSASITTAKDAPCAAAALPTGIQRSQATTAMLRPAMAAMATV
jgi:hypothetical protein